MVAVLPIGHAQETSIQVSQGETVIEVINHEKAAKVKAVYIFQISQFVKWPTSSEKDFRIGVVGTTLIYNTLVEISERKPIHNRPVKVQKYSTIDAVGKGECDVIYISPNISSSDAAKLIASFEKLPVLIFTDSSSRPANTVVNFLIENQKVIFELNNAEAQNKELAMDARLLGQGRVLRSTSQQ